MSHSKMSWSIGHIIASRRWAALDQRLGRLSGAHSQQARDVARSEHLDTIKAAFRLTALPLELQLLIIELLDYDDLKCFA